MAKSVRAAASSPDISERGVPPLQNGDHVTRDEFEARYDAMPGRKNAELIEGIVYLGGRIPWDRHARPHGLLGGWLGTYAAATPGLQAGHNASIRLDRDNEPQPDAALIITPECGGQVKISDDSYIEGAPELVVEISASTVGIDLNAKFRVYRRNGVREYIVWRVEDRAIDWFVLCQGQFIPLAADGAGVVRSEVFPGLWLDVGAAIQLNSSQVLRVLQRGLETAKHAAFATGLNSKARPPE